MGKGILVFARRDDLYHQLINHARGDQTFILVKPGDIYRQLGEWIYQINPQEPADYHRLFNELGERLESVDEVVHLWNYESGRLDYLYHGDIGRFNRAVKRSLIFGIESVDLLTQALASQKGLKEARITYCYHGMTTSLQPQNMMVPGWYLHLPEEQSQFRFTSIHLSQPFSDPSQFAGLLLDELDRDQQESMVTLRFDEAGHREETTDVAPDEEKPKLTIKSHGGYVIVDNRANLGWKLGLELAKKVGCQVFVLGMEEVSAEQEAALAQVNGDGKKLVYEQVPLSDHDAVKRVIQRIKETFHRINGVVYHLNDLDHQSVQHNMDGLLLLDALTSEMPLDFFVAADAMPHSHTDPVRSIPRFSDGFLALREHFVQQKKRMGQSLSVKWEPNPSEEADTTFEAWAQAVEMKIEQSSPATGVGEKAIDVSDEAIKQTLLALIRQGISGLIAETLKIDEDEIHLDFPINLDSANGVQFDSISLARLAEKIRAKYGVKLTPVVFFRHKNLRALIDFLYQKHADRFVDYYRLHLEAEIERTDPQPVVPEKQEKAIKTVADTKTEEKSPEWEWLKEKHSSAHSPNEDEQAIAIVGASGMFPGSPDLQALWNNLEGKKHLITVIPPERWDWRKFDGDPYKEENKTDSKWGGFIDGMDQFDPDFFGISEKEAALMDPRQRLFLETAWKTIEDAGYKMSDLSGTRTAVVIGAGASEYYELMKQHQVAIEEQSSTAKSNSILANRISFLFNFTGPSESIDVACASSLVAIHKAAEYIRNGECDWALAGGVHLILTPDMHISFSKGGVLSQEGKCRIFDQEADGYVRSEGVGAVLLKPLKQALADHDHIYAIIRGSAVNHGGRSNSMTSPNPAMQEEVLVQAYQKAQIHPAMVDYIEVHGASTQLGDPIEVMALQQAFDRLAEESNRWPDGSSCGLGSVKTNLGHTEEAAGMAALFKVLLGLKHNKIPAHLHFGKPNPYIEWDQGPFYIVDQTMDWRRKPDGVPRRAGISTFGFGGVNAHLVVEEAEPVPPTPAPEACLIVFSAKDQTTLSRLAEQMIHYLEDQDLPADAFVNLAYTLQVGREEMTERLALIARDPDELKKGLKKALSGEASPRIYRGRVESSKRKMRAVDEEEVKRCMQEGALEEIARYWVDGAKVEWNRLYPAGRPRRISLPVYPFRKRRFWLPPTPDQEPSGEKPVYLTEGPGSAETDQSGIAREVRGQPGMEFTGNQTVIDLIEAQAEAKPDKTAAVFEGDALTYRQLVDAVHHVAVDLRGKGMKKGELVGIFVNRSLEMLVGVLAVMKAGGAYVPLDPLFPQERLQYMMRDTDLRFILAQHGNMETLPPFAGELVLLDHERIREKPAVVNQGQSLHVSTHPEEVAYVIYTSGSTGNPKGVQITHRNLTNFLYSMAVEPGFNERDTLLAVTTLCFDIAGLELYLPLICGGTVEILPEWMTKDGNQLKEKIERSAATVMQATPAMWQMILAAGWSGKKGFRCLCGGEALNQTLADQLLARCDEVWNLYGPTETTIWSTFSQVRKGKEVTIGRPIAQTQVTIVDERLQPVPAGTQGELCISGAGVAKGYLNRPDLNEQKFIQLNGQRTYRTGDLAFLDEEGEVVLCGRIDHQIKLNGYRIELEEIEVALAALPEVEQAVAVVREGSLGQKVLVAFYKAANGARRLDRQALTEALAKRLPSYMIPTQFVPLDSFPLTLNLKVDRKQLAQQTLDRIMAGHGMGIADREEQEHFTDETDPPALEERLEHVLQGMVADLLALNPETIDPQVNLGDYGFNSVLFTNLALAINRRFATNITAVIFFKHSTVSAIARHLLAICPDAVQRLDREKPMELYPPATKGDLATQDEPIAIIGMYGRMPQSADLDAFWDNLVNNRDMVTEIPADRWDYREYFGNPRKEENKTDSKWGGFVSDVDAFDAGFFGISPREAAYMDPRQRLLTEAVWKTFEDSGYQPDDFSGSKTGLFIGAINSDYWDLINDYGVPADGYTLSGSANSILANRISFLFNLRGPSEVVDTACSSSLIAVDRAVSALKSGKCESAIAGGVNLILTPHLHLALSKNGMLSPDGKCKTFDQSANGYVRGEGVGAVLLKPLSKALQDGDRICAVIRGTAVNHGGKANSLTAPNPEAQTELLVESYTEAGIDPSTVTYIETHGTGTQLGDPIEIEALHTAFDTLYGQWGKEAPQKPHCGLGAVKSNIGHLEAAAGIAGLLKVVLAMQAGTLPANLHAETLNPYIDLEDSYFYLLNENRNWERLKDGDEREIPRRAGVSSFGFGGANAHVILEEFRLQPTMEKESANVVVLSAKNQERLTEYAQALLRYLERWEQGGQREAAATLTDLAYTLQMGRVAMDERLAVVANSLTELKDRLTAYLTGTVTEGVYSGNGQAEKLLDIFDGKAGEAYFQILTEEQDFAKLAMLWTSGVEIDWRRLYGAKRPQRLSLPTYPFAKERYWLPRNTGEPARRDVSANQGLTPLIDSNESHLGGLCYKKTLIPTDWFIRHHVVMGQKILPAVVYLEIVRMAGDLANRTGRVKTLKNVVWLRPIEVDTTNQEIWVQLLPKGEEVEFRVHSRRDGKELVHAQGSILYEAHKREADPRDRMDLEVIKRRCTATIRHEDFYEPFVELGYEYGSPFQPIQHVRRNQTEALARIQLPADMEEGFSDYGLHPSILEGGLQTLAGLLFQKGSPDNIPFVPFSLHELEIIRPLPTSCYAYLEMANQQTDHPTHKQRYHLTLIDEQGMILAKLHDYSVRPLQGGDPDLERVGDRVNAQPVLYRPDVQQMELEGTADARDVEGPVLIFDVDDSFFKPFQQKCGKSQPVILVKPGHSFAKVEADCYEINPSHYPDYERLLADLTTRISLPATVLHRWAQTDFTTRPTTIQLQLERGIKSLFFLCKALAGCKLDRETRVVSFYQAKERSAQPLYKALKGLGKSVSHEHARLQMKVIQLDPAAYGGNEDLVHLLLKELGDMGPDGFVSYEDGQRWVERLAKVVTETSTPPIQDRGVYLITGGFGGLGRIFAEHLIQSGKPRLVLTGRTALSSDKERLIERWKQHGAEVIYVQADVSQRVEVERLAKEIKSRFGSCNGILHCAGEIRDQMLVNKEWTDVSAVLAAKVWGTVHLDDVFNGEALDFFAMFSSVSSLLGNMGQTDYAFANAFLDAFASYRESLRAKGLRTGKTVAFNWPLWKDGGMQVADQVKRFIHQYFGIVPLEKEMGLSAFDRGLGSTHSQLLVLGQDSSKVQSWLSSGSKMKSFQAQPSAAVETEDYTENVKDVVLSAVSKILHLDRDNIDIHKDMNSYGFDSISFTELANRLNEWYQCDLTPAVFFELELPTIASLLALLMERYPSQIAKRHQEEMRSLEASAEPDGEVEGDQVIEEHTLWESVQHGDRQKKDRVPDEPIAIIGMNGVMPQAEDLEAFWHNLQAERDCITEVPADRFKWQDVYGDPLHETNKTDSKWGGFMNNVDQFDALFFGISPHEAELMDPQHRIYLEVVWKAIEDAGYKASDLSGSRTGVYVGMTNHDYADVLNQGLPGIETQGVFGNTHPFLPNRISFMLNLHGQVNRLTPYVPVHWWPSIGRWKICGMASAKWRLPEE